MCACLCTRHGFEQFGITHLSLPDVSQCVLHPLGPPQEIKHPQVVAHTLPCKHLRHTHTHTHTRVYLYMKRKATVTTYILKIYYTQNSVRYRGNGSIHVVVQTENIPAGVPRRHLEANRRFGHAEVRPAAKQSLTHTHTHTCKSLPLAGAHPAS